MNQKIYYQGTVTDLKILEGEGDDLHLKREAVFLGYYGSRLAQLMREPALKVVAIDEGSHLNAVGYPGGYDRESGKVCGLVSEDEMMMESVLEELEWEKF